VDDQTAPHIYVAFKYSNSRPLYISSFDSDLTQVQNNIERATASITQLTIHFLDTISGESNLISTSMVGAAFHVNLFKRDSNGKTLEVGELEAIINTYEIRVLDAHAIDSSDKIYMLATV